MWSNVLDSEERRAHGTVIVLPGIEGHSRWNRSIVRGLHDAGLPYAFEIHDWTLGRWRSLWSLCATDRHREQSRRIADKVATARQRYPQAPVWLIGHSGGGAMAVLALEQLPRDVCAAGAVLLAPAISPTYALQTALSRTQRGIWNFSSWADWFFLIVGTTLVGTLDRRHTVSAGARGFRGQAASAGQGPGLTEVPWRPRMLATRNLAGHFGCVHAAFVREWVAPILAGSGQAGMDPRTDRHSP